MDGNADSIEWTRTHWSALDQPDPEHFVAMAAVFRTYQSIGATIDRIVRHHEITRTAYLLMATLQMSRDHTRPLGQLSKYLMMHPTSITLAVDQLEKKGLAKRSPHPTDRRTVLARLTPEGLEVVERATKALAEEQYGLPGVSPQLAVTLTEILRQVRERIGDIS